MGDEKAASFWSTLPGVLTGTAGLIAAITGLIALFHGKKIDPPPPPPPLALMGPLEHGWNYDHNDLDPDKWVATASAEACSDLCYGRAECKAMTYVIPNQSCWLKYAVPTAKPDASMISAVRRTQ